MIRAVLKYRILSRAAIGDLTGFSRAKVTSVLAHLLDTGILQETEVGESTGGRRPRLLTFNGAFGYVAGVDLGATSVDVALADFSGTVIGHQARSLDVRDGPEPVLKEIIVLLNTLLQANQVTPEQLFGVGMGVPGPVEFDTGLLTAPPIMPGWDQYPIQRTLRKAFPRAQVVVDNDVNMMALGELWAGQGMGVDNFIYVKIGTGIGCGIVAGGRLYRGSTGCAGDIGHICVDASGMTCHCGNVGCLEAMAGGRRIAQRACDAAQNGSSPLLRRWMERDGSLSAAHIGGASAHGDATANQIITESGTMIGEVLASLVNFYNPSLILIGGGVSKIGDRLLTTIRRTVLKRSLPLSTRHLRMDVSAIGDRAGVMGALSVAVETVLNVPE